MRFQELAPPAGTEPFVECLWCFEAGEAREHVIVPDGAVSLTFIQMPQHGRFAGITGPSVTAHRAPLVAGATYAGIRLRPGVAGSVLHGNTENYRGVLGPLRVDTPWATTLRQALHSDRTLLEAASSAARQLSSNAAALDDAVVKLADAIVAGDGAQPLSLLYAVAAVSARQLRRRFKRQCGLSPKELSRLRRVRATCIRLVTERSGLADAAITSGYSDQAHMTREMSAVLGATPRLVDQYLAQIEHTELRRPFSSRPQAPAGSQ
ncbi:MAG: helix-turn-helix domain-containing protein [Myxococcota bacterium]